MRHSLQFTLLALILTGFISGCAHQAKLQNTSQPVNDPTPYGANDPSPRAIDAGLPPGSLQGPITQPIQ